LTLSLKLVGLVYDQPDEQTAIKQAIEDFNVPPVGMHGSM
jgi:hypothetical protein